MNPRKERGMKNLCLGYGDEERMKALTKAEFEALVAKCAVHDEELKRTGKVLMTESLEWAVTTIRARGGKVVVTDGPFVETKEKVGGLFMIEARDLNEAIRIASLHPAAHLGEGQGWAIEVHPTPAAANRNRMERDRAAAPREPAAPACLPG